MRWGRSRELTDQPAILAEMVSSRLRQRLPEELRSRVLERATAVEQTAHCAWVHTYVYIQSFKTEGAEHSERQDRGSRAFKQVHASLKLHRMHVPDTNLVYICHGLRAQSWRVRDLI